MDVADSAQFVVERSFAIVAEEELRRFVARVVAKRQATAPFCEKQQ